MSENGTSRQIFDICVPYAKRAEAPAAYIYIDFGCECPLREEVLKNEFAGIKWNTPLSASELLIHRKPAAAECDESVTIVSINYFEEEGHCRSESVKLGTVLWET